MRVLFINLNNGLSRSEDFLVRLKEMQTMNNLACLANVTLQDRHSVRIVDCDVEDLNDAGLMNAIMEYKPHALVFHVEDAFIEADLRRIAFVKGNYEGAHILISNNFLYHVNINKLSGYELNAVEAIIREEPNDLMPKILDALFENYPAKKISNLRYKDSDKIWHKTDSVFFQHLDAISVPYRKGLKNDLYMNIDKTAPMAVIKATRGSTSTCIYDNIQLIEGNKIRRRSPETIADEIIACYKEFGITHFYLESEDFNHDNDWAYDVSYAIRNSDVCGKVTMFTKIHLKNLEKALIEEMSYSGFKFVIVNMGSGNDESLRRSKIGTNVKAFEEALTILRYYGIRTYAIYRVGYPWEMKKHVEETLKAISNNVHTYLDFKILRPFYMSEAETLLAEEDVLGETTDNITYGIKGTKYMKLAEVEKLYNGFWGKYNFMSKFKKEKINENRFKLTKEDKEMKNKKRSN